MHEICFFRVYCQFMFMKELRSPVDFYVSIDFCQLFVLVPDQYGSVVREHEKIINRDDPTQVIHVDQEEERSKD